jgi:hypothetical protein
MGESLREHVLPPLAWTISPVGSRFAKPDNADDCCDGADKEHYADDRDGQRHDDRGDSHVRLLLDDNATRAGATSA